MNGIESEEHIVVLVKEGCKLHDSLHTYAERGTNLYLQLVNEHGNRVELIILILTFHGEFWGIGES